MNDQSDSQLLRAYAGQGSEPAFAELVRRYIDFVYSTARRLVCDAHRAEDVTQGVFLALAKNAAQLEQRAILSGWLHRTARNIACQTIRTEVRRRAREQEAATMNQLLSNEFEPAWEQIAPHLDAALDELTEVDRDALLLRYFERKSAHQMAQAFGISDEAAQKRVSRAVERLREFFAKRGVTSRAEGLSHVISAHSVQAAPPGLAAAILGKAMAQAAGIATGAKTIGAFAKLGSMKLSVASFQALPTLSSAGAGWLSTLLDWRNFRDRKGFRARIFWRYSWLWILLFGLFMAANLNLSSRVAKDGETFFYLTVATIALMQSANMGRRLAIMRNGYFITLFLTSSLGGIFALGCGLGLLASSGIFYLTAVIMAMHIWFFGQRPLRTDYNLFLRAAENILPPTQENARQPSADPRYSMDELFSFARFMGSRWMAIDYRQTSDSLVLSMPSVKTVLMGFGWTLSFFNFLARRSTLTLHTDGTVTANLHPHEQKALGQMHPELSPEANEWTTVISAAVESAWQEFRDGNILATERALGQRPESDIFLTPTKNSFSTRVQRGFMIGVTVFLVIFAVLLNHLMKSMDILIGTPQQMAEHDFKRAMSDLQHARTEEKRFYALDDAAKESFAVGKIEDARKYATELLALMPKYKGNWNYGNAIADANIVLGRIAMRDHDIAAAEKYLIAAGRGPGSPQLNSFGPDMSLAKELLEAGEQKAVLEYFTLCSKFWKTDHGKLKRWTKAVEKGNIPNFETNLLF